MENYKQFILSKGGHELGLLFCDIENELLTPVQWKRFLNYTQGDTVGLIGMNDSASFCYVCDYQKFIASELKRK